MRSSEQAADLAARNVRLAYSFARRCPPVNGCDPEDVAGAALVGLVRAAQTWQADRGAFSTWAYAHMKNEVRRLRRRRVEVRHLGDADRAVPDRSPTDPAPLARRARQLRRRVERLPEPHRSVVLRRLEGASVRQLARERSVGRGTVERLWQASIRLMREGRS